jgi:hypothetical protein
LLIMPAQGFNALSPEDLGALIAYVKSVPAVDNVPEASDVQILGRALFVGGQIQALAAELKAIYLYLKTVPTAATGAR